MSVEPSKLPSLSIPFGIYPHLLTASAQERTLRFLELLKTHSAARLVLTIHEGQRATLDGIDLSPENLLKQFEGAPHPEWWHPEHQGVDLRNLNLSGASLRHADLRGALLESANLIDVDLAGADLRAADLSGAFLQEALFEDANLAGAVLRFAQGQRSVWEQANLQGADLWGAEMEGAELRGANLEGAVLEEANFQGANLRGANLRGAVLKRTNLKGANLQGADLREAILGDANLEEAVLQDAKLEELDLTHCNITLIYTSGARLERTRFDQEQLGSAIGEERDRKYALARKGYLVLERNFDEMGDHEAGRWAYQRRRRMEKYEALEKARTAWKQRQRGLATRLALKYVGDQFVELLCDYGESISRVLGTLLLVYFLFIFLYGVTGTVLRVEHGPEGTTKSPTSNLSDLALFSLAAMTSPGTPPNYLAHRNEWAYLLAGTQTVLSIFLTGLMGFVAGNRIRR